MLLLLRWWWWRSRRRKKDSSNICVWLTLLFGVLCSVFTVQLFALIPKFVFSCSHRIASNFYSNGPESTSSFMYLCSRFSIHIPYHFIRLYCFFGRESHYIVFVVWLNKKKVFGFGQKERPNGPTKQNYNVKEELYSVWTDIIDTLVAGRR